MADCDLSSDLEDSRSSPEPRTLPVVQKQTTRKRSYQTASTSQALPEKRSRKSSAASKDESRRHKALERHFDKVRKSVTSVPSASLSLPPITEAATQPQQLSTLQCNQPLPLEPSSVPSPGPMDLSRGASRPQWAPPEATFTPTAAGLRTTESTTPAFQYDIPRLISETISRTLAANAQHQHQGHYVAWPQAPPPPPPPPPGHPQPRHQHQTMVHPETAQHDYEYSGDSSSEEEGEIHDTEFSDDEGMLPDKPAFSGLFRPSLFKSLLHKAKLTTKMADSSSTLDQQAQPHDDLFTAPKTEKAFIPCPQLFSDVVQRSWASPSSLPSPTGLDKKLYCSAPSLQDLLQLPTVDAPVANLVSSSVLSNDAADGLRTEDRKAELTFRRTHNAAAWAVKAATSASFFSRASLIWLRQLQERLPTDDTRLHQDVNKLVAATEYMADASLNAAKFASRALVSSVTSRRLLWLKHWRADIKSKWRLASVPYKGSRLFGEALDPILVEDKDKRKVMPSSYRRAERKFTPYSFRQPFRTDAGPAGPFATRPYSQGFDRSSDRATFRDRGQRPPPAKRPFRGTGTRFFRRGK